MAISNIASALTEPPVLLRACINADDSTITIDYRNPADNCGSFVRYLVYGKENGSSYGILAQQTNFSATSIKIKLTNSNITWSFYFEAQFLCNGVDKINSNIIAIDSEKPVINEIDSVSIDLLSQKIIVGWTKNAAPDTKGYRIYKNSNGINSTLGESQNLGFTINDQPAYKPIFVSLAAFDSCNFFSPISSVHSPIVLSGTYDPCTKQASLSWSTYVGWNTKEYNLYSSLNSAPYLVVNKSIIGNSLTTQINPGDSVCYFIRAYKDGSNFTSSSNNFCIKAKPLVLPNELYLSVASVKSNDLVEIQVYIDNIGNTDSLVIYNINGTIETPIKSFKVNGGINSFNVTDQKNTTTQSYVYMAKTFAPCVGVTKTSNIGKTIYLKLNTKQKSLSWNPYEDWYGGVSNYILWGFDGSTWNIIDNTTNTNILLLDSNTCYRVEAEEFKNKLGLEETSQSNVVCLIKEPTFYVPNALNTSGGNNTFRVIGTSLDYEKSSFIIFDRWGGVMHESNNISVGWSVGAESNTIPTGVYFYILNIVDLSGNKHKSSGSFRVIR